MTRFTAALLLPAVALTLWADDQKADKPRAVKALPIRPKAAPSDAPPSKGKEAYDALTEDFDAKMEEAEKPADRKELLAGYARKFLAHAKDFAKDPTAVDALIRVLTLNRSNKDKDKDTTRAEALALLKGYLKSTAISDHLRRLAGMGEDVITLVQEVAKDGPDKRTRALAYRALISARNRAVRIAESLQNNEKFRASYEKAMGKEAVETLVENAEKFAKELQAYRDRLSAGELKGVLPDVSVGAVAPETEAVDLDGKKVKLSDHKGKVVVLDFWATWCGPCRAMLPHTRGLVKDMAGKPFEMIAVSVDDTPDKVVEFRKKNDMPWAQWWVGRKGRAVELWDVEGYPTVIVIDHKGVIRHVQLGFNPESDRITEVVEKLVAAAEKDRKAETE